MAIVVLVLWLFTAGAGFYLLVTSNLGRARPASPSSAPVIPGPPSAAEASGAAGLSGAAKPCDAAEPSGAADVLAAPVPVSVASGTPAVSGAAPASAVSSGQAPSKRAVRRAARDRFDPPSLIAAKNAPMVPGLRSLLEFAHPAFAAIGLGFWLGFTLVHNRALGWIAFGLVTATVGLGLTWFTANARAAKVKRRDQGEPPSSFGIRLVVLHGGAATVTFALAALTALVLSR